MLTPAYLAGCADQVAAMFSQLEADITADVAARVAKMGRYSETSQWQAQKLREAEAAYDMCQRMLKTCRKSANKEIQEVLLNGCREAMRADDSIYRAAGMHTYSISSSEALMDIILAGLAKTNGVMDNLTMTTARDASHSIQSALDRAYMQVMSGAYSYDQAAARVIRDLGSKGYTCFKYDSGTHTSLEAATRRALLTGLNQTTAELQLHRATDLGTELVEVSSHAGARPTHAVWQGEIYSLHGDTGKYRDFYRETEYGDGDGLCGWNCYHNFYPYVEGVSAPTFEKDPARRLGKTNDELYEETQQQRYYERQVRKSRRECSTLSAAMDEADDLLRERLRPEFTKASVLLKRREAALRVFCEKTGLPYDASRVTTFAFGRSTSAKAVWANRKAANLTDSVNGGTIDLKSDDETIRAYIRSSVVRKQVNVGNQNKHIRTSHAYTPDRSYIFGDIDTAQSLVDTYHGTGEIKRNARSGEWSNREVITADRDIGVSVDPDSGSEQTTNRFTIHYGKRGTHIVPTRRKTE